MKLERLIQNSKKIGKDLVISFVAPVIMTSFVAGLYYLIGVPFDSQTYKLAEPYRIAFNEINSKLLELENLKPEMNLNEIYNLDSIIENILDGNKVIDSLHGKKCLDELSDLSSKLKDISVAEYKENLIDASYHLRFYDYNEVFENNYGFAFLGSFTILSWFVGICSFVDKIKEK